MTGVVPLANLPPDHKAVRYVAERGFDPGELSRIYGIGYYDRPDPEVAMANGRIIIPVSTEGRLIGWQARFVGERDWSACTVPKYYGMRGMAKNFALYNVDQARTHPWSVLVEGVTDVWAIGSHAIGLLGKSISFAQRRILQAIFRDRPLVVMLDGDAQRENEAITRYLAESSSAGVVCVTLPGGQDPAMFTKSDLATMILREADRRGIVLPPLG